MKRQHRTESDWQDLIQQQKESGQTLSQFCQEHAINPKYFYSVKSKLKNKNTPGNFHKVNVISQDFSAITLSMGALSLSVPTSVDSDWLASLIHKLATSC